MIKEIKKGWLFFLIMCIAIGYTVKTRPEYDDTDPVDGRSGFRLMIDHGTGCQYLQGGIFGGLHPRLDRNGNHICEMPKSQK